MCYIARHRATKRLHDERIERQSGFCQCGETVPAPARFFAGEDGGEDRAGFDRDRAEEGLGDVSAPADLSRTADLQSAQSAV